MTSANRLNISWIDFETALHPSKFFFPIGSESMIYCYVEEEYPTVDIKLNRQNCLKINEVLISRGFMEFACVVFRFAKFSHLVITALRSIKVFSLLVDENSR